MLDGEGSGFRGVHEDKGVIRLEAGGLSLLEVDEDLGRGNFKFVGSEEVHDLVNSDGVVNSGHVDGEGGVPLLDAPDGGLGLHGALKSSVVGVAHGIERDPALVDGSLGLLRTCLSAEILCLK